MPLIICKEVNLIFRNSNIYNYKIYQNMEPGQADTLQGVLEIPNLDHRELPRLETIDLGLEWSEDELSICHDHHRKFGLSRLNLLKQQLNLKGYNRPIVNLHSLFSKLKDYLEFNPNCTASEIKGQLHQPEIIQEENIGRRRISPVEAWREISNHIENASFSSTNLKRLKISRRDFIKDESKSLIPSGKFIQNLSFENDSYLLKKVEQLAGNCRGSREEDEGKGELYSSYLNWINDEYFVSHIDQPYFKSNSLSTLLKKANVKISEGGSPKLKIQGWNSFRKMLGKPRRFSRKFVNDELQNLNKYRERVRIWMTNKQIINDGSFAPELIRSIERLPPLEVSQNVLAISPRCGHIHTGKILLKEDRNIMVNFIGNNLGAQRVPDFNIKIISADTNHDFSLHKTGNETNRSLGNTEIFDFETEQNMQVLKEIDPFATALLVKVLERKTMLVNELKTLNDLAEKKTNQLNEVYFEDYGWIGNQIGVTDQALKHITAKFRLRGFNEDSSKKIGKNFENIFNIFKKNIEREIEGSTGNLTQTEELSEVRDYLSQSLDEKIVRDVLSDMKVLLPPESIKLLEETIETQTEEDIHDFTDNNGLESKGVQKVRVESACGFNIRKGMTSQEKSHLMQLILDCGGILRTLISTHDINLKENVFLQNLFSLARDYKKECHEISDVLLSLSSKIRTVH